MPASAGRCLPVILMPLLLPAAGAAQQPADTAGSLDPTAWGVVYDVPATRLVMMRPDVVYDRGDSGDLKLDLYLPPDLTPGERRPAVVFLNAIGDRPGDPLRRWAIYRSWPRLVAAHGMVGVAMDADPERVGASLARVFRFLREQGGAHHVDPERLGVYAASANVGGAVEFLMGREAPPGIRAAVLYYGGVPAWRLRADLPVLFLVAQADAAGMAGALPGLWQRVVDSALPWTLVFARGQPHGFDAFSDTDDARRLVRQTLGFWDAHLGAVPSPPWPPSEARAIVAATYANQPARAAELLERWIASHPRDREAHRQHARQLVALRRFDDADRAYRRALALDSTNPGLLAGMGQLRLAQRRWAEAVEYLRQAIDRGVRHGMIYGQVAWAELNLGRYADAARDYEKALELGVPPGPATRGLAWYNLGCAYARLGRLDSALAALEQAADAGMTDRATYEQDDDLAPLRGDPRFGALLGRLRGTAGS